MCLEVQCTILCYRLELCCFFLMENSEICDAFCKFIMFFGVKCCDALAIIGMQGKDV